MLDFLYDPKVMTFVCFGLWLVSGVVFTITAVLHLPTRMPDKIDFKHPAYLAGVFNIMIWITMWGFRTMY